MTLVNRARTVQASQAVWLDLISSIASKGRHKKLFVIGSCPLIRVSSFLVDQNILSTQRQPLITLDAHHLDIFKCRQERQRKTNSSRLTREQLSFSRREQTVNPVTELAPFQSLQKMSLRQFTRILSRCNQATLVHNVSDLRTAHAARQFRDFFGIDIVS